MGGLSLLLRFEVKVMQSNVARVVYTDQVDIKWSDAGLSRVFVQRDLLCLHMVHEIVRFTSDARKHRHDIQCLAGRKSDRHFKGIDLAFPLRHITVCVCHMTSLITQLLCYPLTHLFRRPDVCNSHVCASSGERSWCSQAEPACAARDEDGLCPSRVRGRLRGS